MTLPYAQTTFSLGSSLPIANTARPKNRLAVAGRLDFGTGNTVNGDLQNILGLQQGLPFEFVQGVYIDNSINPFNLRITFTAVNPVGFTIHAKAFSQGFYPCPVPVGNSTFIAISAPGAFAPIEFYNIEIAPHVWDTPPDFTRLDLGTGLAAPLIVGDNTIVPAVAGHRIALMTGMYSTSGVADNLTWKSGAANILMGPLVTPIGGSINFPSQRVPWLLTNAGEALVLNSTGGSTLGGMLNYAVL